MFARLFILFVTIPCVELMLLFTLGRAIGLVPTVCIVLSTGALGAFLARRQGLAALNNIRGALGEGRVPAAEIIDGFLIFVAGLLLITPGFLTDTVGFCLLVPVCRVLVRRRVLASLKRHVFRYPGGEGGASSPEAERSREDADVIDVEAERLDR